MPINLSKSFTWITLESHWDQGFEQLMAEEKETIALYWLEAECINGGLDQFFHNTSGDLAPLALAGLKRLNCMKTYTVLNDLMLLIFGENYPIEREGRFPYLEKIEA